MRSIRPLWLTSLYNKKESKKINRARKLNKQVKLRGQINDVDIKYSSSEGRTVCSVGLVDAS